ncbi:MAG: hypothetical protein KME67_05230 [Candidatus Thiodiazotropha sp. (ex Codakia orbicularis)]|nr:hypothetical protein [Candidatus Thiodiazotropha sp. (ex Codakia orbicularis)]
MSEMKEFDQWWHESGSGLTPSPDQDQESHARAVAKQYWNACLRHCQVTVSGVDDCGELIADQVIEECFEQLKSLYAE